MTYSYHSNNRIKQRGNRDRAKDMKNLFKSCLLLTSLLTLTHRTESTSDVIAKDSHRIVVVEYNKDGETNTRVVISPPQERDEEEKLLLKRNVKKKVRETTSSLQNHICHGISSHPGELICDALGKYKHKMSSMLRKVKNITTETARDLSEEAREVEETVWGRVKSVVWCFGRLVKEEMKLTKVGSVMGLMGIAAAYGTCVWVTFVSRYVLGLVLGRDQFGVVKSKVYPVYFKAISVWIVVGLLGHLVSQKKKIVTNAVEMWQAVNLVSSLLMVEANASFVEPRATKTMFERMKVEREKGRGGETFEFRGEVKERLVELSERLSRLNVYSSWLNMLTLLSLTWHFVYLGQRLSSTC